MAKGKIYIGTSGWSYRDWNKHFYPDKMRSADFLTYYNLFYKATEINSSFYHLTRVSTIEGWLNGVDPEFKFCPKLSQYTTHMKRLLEPEESLQKFFNSYQHMKSHLGPVLVQLPPSLKFNAEVAEHFFKLLHNTYSEYEFAIEPRHETWFDEPGYDLMKAYNITLVISESGKRFPYSEEITAKNVYLRFHGPEKLYGSGYTDLVMKKYANKIKKWSAEGHPVWVFFNNTMYDDALKNSKTLEFLLDAQ